MALNRAADTQCYQCQAELGEAPPPPPPVVPPTPEGPAGEQAPWAGGDVPQRRIGAEKTEKGYNVKPKDLSARYERKEIPVTDATVLHGLRAAPLAGLVMGAVMGMMRNYYTDETAVLLSKKFKIARNGLPMMEYSLAVDLGFSLVMGLILGLTNLLCFAPEAGRAGAVIGALTAAGIIFMAPHGANYFNVVIGLIHGFLLAYLISQTERKLFRGL